MACPQDSWRAYWAHPAEGSSSVWGLCPRQLFEVVLGSVVADYLDSSFSIEDSSQVSWRSSQ